MSFVHLHSHTKYSLLDGAIRLEEVIQLAKKYKMPALAITDHGNMYGVIDFYQSTLEKGIKPIIGMEAYIINGSIYSEKDKKNNRYHLTLLAKDKEGYYNLSKLSSISFLDGFYYKPRIDKELLKKHSKGLIGLSGCMKGEIPQLLLAGKYKKAKRTLELYQKIFGKDDFYLEIMRLGLEGEEELIGKMKELSAETGAEIVCTNDNHYIRKSDAKAHDTLLCIQTGKLLTDEKRMRFNTDKVYFRSSEEMKTLFRDIPEAIENTLKIADKCNLKLEFDKFLLPKISIPPKYKSMYEYLNEIVYKGAKKKYGKLTDKIKDRIEYEMDIIDKMGFIGYFLITQDIVSTARKMNVMVGPGRGSAAGSIIAYLSDITRVDPLRYNLLFERFLNPARVSMPDIDIDFSADGRNKVLDYIVKKFGRKNVCQIITMGSLGAKMVVRDVGRVMNIPLDEVDNIAKKIPSKSHVKLEDAIKENPKLKQLINKKKEYKELIKYSKILEGLPRHSGVHAAAVVIGPDDLINYVPLAKNIKEDTVVTQYEGKWLETIKMLKMDCLGLKNLTIIEKALEMIKTDHNIEIDIDNIELNDIKTYKMLCDGDTDGIFQFEGAGMRDVIRQVKPECIEDLAACTALYRPGPLGSGMHEVYIRRKKNQEKVKYLNPIMEKILKPTYGVIVYQEQVMQIANKLAGFTLSEADILRKAMSKKKRKLMQQYEPKFIKGAMQKGISANVASDIFNLIKQFGQYGFNKSHSVAYSIISYQTAYLKAHYPAEYMAALMTVENDNDKRAKFIDDCTHMGIEVLPPDINKSYYDFTVENKKIIFGLKAIKNVGRKAANSIVTSRIENKKFKNIYELCEKVSAKEINKTTLESLICAGAMDSLENNRAEKFSAIENALKFGTNKNKERRHGQSFLFDNPNNSYDSDKYPPLHALNDWDISYKLEQEKEHLGFYISGHPLLDYKTEIELFTNCNTKKYREYHDKGKVEMLPRTYRIIAIVDDISIKKDKNGNLMSFVQFEDMYEKFEGTIFSSLYAKYSNELKEGNILYLIGKISKRDNDDSNLKLIINDIIPIEKLAQKISAKVFIYCNEENYNKNMMEELVNDYLELNNGNCTVHFQVKTKYFGNLDIVSQKYKIYPDKKIFDFINKNNNCFKKITVKFDEN